MKLPNTMKIGFRTYDIIFPNDFKDINHCGITDYERQEIRIGEIGSNGAKYKNDSIIQTTMHEVIHAIEAGCGHRVFKKEDGSVNECAVDAWAEWLCMVFRDNPEFTKLLLMDERKK